MNNKNIEQDKNVSKNFLKLHSHKKFFSSNHLKKFFTEEYRLHKNIHNIKDTIDKSLLCGFIFLNNNERL